MLSTLKKNAIIAGNISSYCLVCEQYLECVDDTAAHVEESTHTEELLAHAYLEKYGDNHIRKVNKGYYCEFCSLLLATAAKVSLHVQENRHYDNKGAFLLRRSHGAVIAFEDVLISEKAWHGLAEDTCAICNVEFDDESIHKSESRHQLNLVQVKIEFGANNSVYRKADDTSFQCLTCNNVFALNEINEHFDDSEHKKLYVKSQEAMKKHEATKAQEKSTKPETKNKKKDTDKKSVDNNSNDVAAKANSKDKGKQETDSAKTNGETNQVNGKEPKSKVKAAPTSKPKPLITKSSMKTFTDSFLTVENMFFHDVVLNDKLCMATLSYLMITKTGSRFRCQVCEVNFSDDDIDLHRKGPKHMKALEETPVITSLDDSEFVREVRPEVYHCGYCNLVASRWEQLTAHLQSTTHRESKGAAQWRLQLHMPGIHRYRAEKQTDLLQKMMFARMFGDF